MVEVTSIIEELKDQAHRIEALRGFL